MNIVWLAWKDRGHPTAGGAEVVAHELMTRLVAAGHTVTLLTGGYTDPATGQPAPRHGTDPAGYHIVRTGNRLSTYLTTAWYYHRHRRQLAPQGGGALHESRTVATALRRPCLSGRSSSNGL